MQLINIYIYNLGIRVSKDPNVVYLPVVIHSVQVVSDCSFVKVVFIFFKCFCCATSSRHYCVTYIFHNPAMSNSIGFIQFQ